MYDVWLAFELGVVYFFYVETQNTPLEEIVKHFDGEEALLGGTLATERAKQLLVENGKDEKHGAVHVEREVSSGELETPRNETVTTEKI